MEHRYFTLVLCFGSIFCLTVHYSMRIGCSLQGILGFVSVIFYFKFLDNNASQ